MRRLFAKFSRGKNKRFNSTESNLGPIGAVKTIGLGFVCLSFAIPFIAINERRNDAQIRFREKCETVCQELDPENTEEIKKTDTKLVHSVGNLHLKDPKSTPRDDFFQLSKKEGTPALKIKRESLMFQHIEHKEEHRSKDKDGKETVTYTYSYTQGWSATPQTMHGPSPPGHNPGFPSGLSGPHVFQKDLDLGKIHLSDNFLRKVEDFEPLLISDTDYNNGTSTDRIVNENKIYLGKDRFAPKIGDIEVSFSYVPEAIYTTVAKNLKGTLTEYTGVLNKKLRDEGEIKVPTKEIDKLVESSGIKSADPKFVFHIPVEFIDYAESLVLSMTPIQIDFLKKGNYDKTQSFVEIAHQDDEKNMVMRVVGFIIAFVSCAMILTPVKLVNQNTHLFSAALSAFGITYETIKLNSKSFHNKKEKEGDEKI